MKNRVILHCDMNNFYASVECKKDPSIAHLPVAVGGDVESRTGIILAKNYIAKSYGVKTAQTIGEAKILCPGLIILPPDFCEYARYSHRARGIYERYTDKVEPFGLDECWLDVTGSVGLFGDGEEIAHKIRNDIKRELGITASVGVSYNKIFAKLGSDMKKPDAVTVIGEGDYREKIWHLAVSDLMGVGKRTLAKLNSVGVFTIGQLAAYPEKELVAMLGKCGGQIWRYANGLDNSEVIAKQIHIPEKSISHGITAKRDMKNAEEVWCVMLELCQELGSRLYSCNMWASGVAIQIKDSNLCVKQWQKKLFSRVQSPFLLAREGFSLFSDNYKWRLNVRAVSIAAIGLKANDECEQINIFGEEDEKIKKVDMTVQRLRERFGEGIVRNACLVGHPLLDRDMSSLMEKMAQTV